jgi:hypothetical protein
LKTLSVVNRDHAPALRTAIFPVLLVDKSTGPHFPDICQILFHAHAVIPFISIVDALDLFAGILAAIKAKSSISL